MKKLLLMIVTVTILLFMVNPLYAERLYRAKANGPAGYITCNNDQYYASVSLIASTTTSELTNINFQIYDKLTNTSLGYGYGYLPDKTFSGSINSGLSLEIMASNVKWVHLSGQLDSLSVFFEPFTLDDESVSGFKERIAGTQEVETAKGITHTSGTSTWMYTVGEVVFNGTINMNHQNSYCVSRISDNKGVTIVFENKLNAQN